jgi:hypothetical protein
LVTEEEFQLPIPSIEEGQVLEKDAKNEKKMLQLKHFSLMKTVMGKIDTP